MDAEHPFRAGMVSLTRRKVRGDVAAGQQAMDDVNQFVREHADDWSTARFEWVGVVIQHVEEPTGGSRKPVVHRVTRDGELPVLVEVEVPRLRGLDHDSLVAE
ncbi:MAG: hypothetical protein M3P85_03420 [Actinomycetota bacterium]|nr:hypothetical protein [Actinomycetota bacterium]